MLAEIAGYISYLFYLNFGRDILSCGSVTAELVALQGLLPITSATLLFTFLAYYFLLKGQKLHDLLFALYEKQRP